MYKEDLALNNLLGLICHKTQPNQTNPSIECLKANYLANPIESQILHLLSCDSAINQMVCILPSHLQFVIQVIDTSLELY